MCEHNGEQANFPNSAGGGISGGASGGSLGGYPYVYPQICPTCNRCPTCGNYKFPYYQPYVTYNQAGGRE